MTQPEQRVLDDLRALAAGFTVTERDVDRAQDRLHARLAGPPPRSRRTMLVALVAAAAVAVVLAVLGGVLVLDRVLGQNPPPPAGEEREPVAPAVDQLIGIWALDARRSPSHPWGRTADPRPFVIRFSPDGSFALSGRGDLDGHPYAKGSFEVDGRTIRFLSTEGLVHDGCDPGQSWAWQADLVRDGELAVTVIEPPFDDCLRPYGTEWTLVRVSPGSPPSTDISAGPRGEGTPVSHRGLLHGLWLREGSGLLLYRDPSGNYVLDDDGELGVNPDDVGTLEVVDAGMVVFTSGPGSADCAEGDRMVWEGVEWDVTTISLRGVVVSSDTCASRGRLGGTWIGLAP